MTVTANMKQRGKKTENRDMMRDEMRRAIHKARRPLFWDLAAIRNAILPVNCQSPKLSEQREEKGTVRVCTVPTLRPSLPIVTEKSTGNIL